MKIDPESWEEWQAHPLTEALMKLCDVTVERTREQWAAMSFDRGSCDPLELVKMRARAAAFQEIRKMTPEQVMDVLG